MNTPLARIETETEGANLCVRLLGEVDLSNAETLREQITALIGDSDSASIVIDLSAVDYIDSQGVMLLLEVASSLSASQRPLRLMAPADSVAGELLTIAHLGDLPVERVTGETRRR